MSDKKKEPKVTAAPAAPQAEPLRGGITSDQRNVALICHLSGLFWFIVPGLNIIIPLIVMLAKAKDDPFLAHHGRQALIYQVIMSVMLMVLVIMGLVLLIVLIGVLFLGMAVMVAIVDVILILKATFAAARGERYSYPFMGGI